MFSPAQRLLDLPANFFSNVEQQIAAYQQAGKDVIRLDIGSPDMPPPPEVIRCLVDSASRPDTHGYQPHLGPAALRQAWAEMYARVHRVELDPDQEILPLMGSKEGIFNLLMSWINPGEVVLVPDPGYMTYTRGTLFAGGVPFYLPLRPENGYLPDLESIPPAVLSQARILWLNYPNNPTGAVADADLFPVAVKIAQEHGLLVCHDAAYTQVCFDGYRAPSILEIPDARQVAVEFNSLSKSHNMPGWRVGVLVGNRQALQAVFRVKSNLDSGHFRPVLEAAVTAMRGDQGWMVERNQVYQHRRDLVVQALQKMGLSVHVPQAAIYIWAQVPAGWSDVSFAASVLEQSHVSLTPGTVFGAAGAGAVRIALTTPAGRLQEAMQRLQEWRG